MQYRYAIAAVFVVILTFTAQNVFAQSNGILADKRLIITVGNRVLNAVLIDNETTQDLLTMLPMTVKANDYNSREKYWHLSRPLSAKGKRQNEYERGDIGFWLPNSDMALFYNHDGSILPSPGLIVVAKVTSGLGTPTEPAIAGEGSPLDIFNKYPGSLEFTIDLVDL